MKTISPTGRNGALYAAHCYTSKLARAIMGTQSDVSRVDISAPMPRDALFRFRCKPQYRSPEALELRRQVCELVLHARQIRRARQ